MTGREFFTRAANGKEICSTPPGFLALLEGEQIGFCSSAGWR